MELPTSGLLNTSCKWAACVPSPAGTVPKPGWCPNQVQKIAWVSGSCPKPKSRQGRATNSHVDSHAVVPGNALGLFALQVQT